MLYLIKPTIQSNDIPMLLPKLYDSFKEEILRIRLQNLNLALHLNSIQLYRTIYPTL